MNDDPERLVAEALRAHAARTPLPAAPAAEPLEGTSPVLGSYGLLSGSGVTLPAPEATPQPPTVHDPVPGPAADETNRIVPGAGIASGWIILLALLLGLAAGAVVGLVTLL